MAKIDSMAWRDFEHVVARLLEHAGYEVEMTKHFDDGADVIASKDGVRTAVQVKQGQQVRRRAVEQVVASRAPYSCAAAMVVTNGFFTDRARRLARLNDVELWDRRRFIRELSGFCCLCGETASRTDRRWSLERRADLGARIYCRAHRPTT